MPYETVRRKYRSRSCHGCGSEFVNHVVVGGILLCPGGGYNYSNAMAGTPDKLEKD